MSKTLKIFLGISVGFVLIIAGIVIYLLVSNQSSKLKDVVDYTAKKVQASNFAKFIEIPVKINPQVESYTVEKDLSNVENISDFSLLSDEAKKKIAENAFVVSPGNSTEFYEIYETNRYNYIPNFITTDSVMHNYHLFFDYLLRDLETNKLAPTLKKLNKAMLEKSQSQYKSLKGTDLENAAKRNVAFYTVASKLLDESTAEPSYVNDIVTQEMNLIEAHQGINESPMMNLGAESGEIYDTPQGSLDESKFKEDYSQYVPRGHYTKSELLKKYFKSMMWYGRMNFRLKSIDETKSAVLTTMILSDSKEIFNLWESLFEPINFFVGKTDDISFYDYNDLIIKTYGDDLNLESLKDENKLKQFIDKAKGLEPPQVNSMPIMEAGVQSDREEEIKGFRFLGQRFTIDASIFQRLMYREVGDKTKSCDDYDPEQASCLSGARCLPNALDVASAMGSDEAYKILDSKGETKYACYKENTEKMQSYVKSLTTDTWTQNLYWGWLFSLKSLTEDKGEGYPSFMQSDNWMRKQLTTYLGSWTELKHDTILYAKQAYAELGGGGEPEEKDDRGYVEPEPHLYARLAGLIQMTIDGLSDRNLLEDKNKTNLNKLKDLVVSLKEISEKELNGEKVSDKDYELIKTYGGTLEHLWLDTFSDEEKEKAGGQLLKDNPAALIADVATDPNGEVLEEGIGRIFDIYVVVPIDGKLRLASGGVFSHYEFKQPMGDRLTDEAWREKINSGDLPALADWTDGYISSE